MALVAHGGGICPAVPRNVWVFGPAFLVAGIGLDDFPCRCLQTLPFSARRLDFLDDQRVLGKNKNTISRRRGPNV